VSATFAKTSYFHNLSPFVSETMICVHDFPHGEVSVKVGVMEFGLYTDSLSNYNFTATLLMHLCLIIAEILVKNCHF